MQAFLIQCLDQDWPALELDVRVGVVFVVFVEEFGGVRAVLTFTHAVDFFEVGVALWAPERRDTRREQRFRRVVLSE